MNPAPLIEMEQSQWRPHSSQTAAMMMLVKEGRAPAVDACVSATGVMSLRSSIATFLFARGPQWNAPGGSFCTPSGYCALLPPVSPKLATSFELHEGSLPLCTSPKLLCNSVRPFQTARTDVLQRAFVPGSRLKSTDTPPRHSCLSHILAPGSPEVPQQRHSFQPTAAGLCTY